MHGEKVIMGRDVWVLLETEAKKINIHSASLLDEGGRIAEELGGELHAIYLGPHLAGLGQQAGSRGAVRLFVYWKDSLTRYDPCVYEKVLLNLLQAGPPRLLLALSSSTGSDLLPRLAWHLQSPLVTNCVEIEIQDEKEIHFIKPIQNGRLHATVVCEGEGPRMATFLPESLIHSEMYGGRGRTAEIRVLKALAEERDPPIRVIEFVKADHRTIDIREAETIVAVGRGLGTKENLAVVQAFADRIGAAIGGTRPVVDAGILPYERQIGQTGKRVSPKLIFLCGISGAMEFTKGIEQAGTKIAINIDRECPVFHSVDLGIVGDLKEVTPRMTTHLSQRSAPPRREKHFGKDG